MSCLTVSSTSSSTSFSAADLQSSVSIARAVSAQSSPHWKRVRALTDQSLTLRQKPHCLASLPNLALKEIVERLISAGEGIKGFLEENVLVWEAVIHGRVTRDDTGTWVRELPFDLEISRGFVTALKRILCYGKDKISSDDFDHIFGKKPVFERHPLRDQCLESENSKANFDYAVQIARALNIFSDLDDATTAQAQSRILTKMAFLNVSDLPVESLLKDLKQQKSAVAVLEIYQAGKSTQVGLSCFTIFALPPILETMHGIAHLQLINSYLSHVPKGLSKLKGLKTINLCHNHIRVLPAEIGRLTTLEKLEMHYNFIGELPDELWDLPVFVELGLFSNKLKSLSGDVGRSSSLRVLNLSQNELTELPASIGTCSNLQSLYVAQNRLKTVPAEIENLKTLWYWDVRDNPELVWGREMIDMCERMRKIKSILTIRRGASEKVKIHRHFDD